MKASSHSAHRYPEIDLLRTIAILGMIVYHAAYDLWAFYGWNFDPLHGRWWFFARTTAVLFLLVSGASNTIANARAKNAGGAKAMWKRTRERSLHIAGAALLVTIVTYVIDPNTYIRFGILHCIAMSVFLLPLFQKYRQWNLLLGTGMMVLGNVIMGMTAHTSLLLPVGILPTNFSSLDYFPLLPWFGVVLIGSAIADFVYVRERLQGMALSIFQSSRRRPEPHFPLATAMSRWTLIIYLLHQPLIFLFLMMIFGMPTTYIRTQ